MSQGSGISSNLDLIFSQLHKQCLKASCPLRAFIHRLHCHTLPGLSASLKPQQNSRTLSLWHLSCLQSQPHEDSCQIQQPAWSGTWRFNIIFLAASIYFLEAENSLGPFVICKLRLVGSCPEGILLIFFLVSIWRFLIDCKPPTAAFLSKLHILFLSAPLARCLCRPTLTLWVWLMLTTMFDAWLPQNFPSEGT